MAEKRFKVFNEKVICEECLKSAKRAIFGNIDVIDIKEDAH